MKIIAGFVLLVLFSGFSNIIHAQTNEEINEIQTELNKIKSINDEIQNQLENIYSNTNELKTSIQSIQSSSDVNTEEIKNVTSELSQINVSLSQLNQKQNDNEDIINKIWNIVNNSTLGWVAWASAIGTVLAIIIAGLIFWVQHNQGNDIHTIVQSIGGDVGEQSNVIKVRREYFQNSVNSSLPKIKRGLEQNIRYLKQFSEDPEDQSHNYYIDSEMDYIITNVLSEVDTLEKMIDVTKGTVHPKSEENLIEICKELKRWYVEPSPYSIEIHWKHMHGKIIKCIDYILENNSI